MTTFGKILVFVNLVFSLVVCALVIMVYIARTNWKEAYESQKRVADAAQLSANTAADQVRAAHQEADKKVQEAQAKEKASTDERDIAKKDLAAKETEYQKLLKGRASLDAQVQKLLVDVQRRSEEVKKLEDNLKGAIDQKTELVKEMNRLRDEATKATLDNKVLQAHNQNLMTKFEESEKERIRMKSAGTVAAGKPAVNPPTENVEGVVKRVDSTGLVSITIGSDSGVLKGHTLEVFRLEPSPLYLGTIRILETRPHEAVGQPLSRPRAPIQQGDRVASRIGQGG